MKESTFGATIARLRKQAGMTQSELGQAVGVSMQAVSRWEHGGTPDIELLPELADVLGVSLDTLLNRNTEQAVDIEALLQRELLKIPVNERLSYACRLAWQIMKLTTASIDPTGDSSYPYMTSSEDVDRKSNPVPESVPSLIYVSHNSGLMQASQATDFRYVLFMPEPEDGYAAIMKYPEEYRRFFTFLSKPNRIEMVSLFYSLKPQQYFTVPFAAKALNISEADAEAIMEEMYQNRMVLKLPVEMPTGELCIYQRIQDTAWIPFLYFATELMRAQDIISALHMRNLPFFKAPLGSHSLSPRWRTREDLDRNRASPVDSRGCMDTM